MMRLAICAMLALVVAGCKTERDSEDPVILGVPPEDAYLGVEYSYNFGAVDEDDILNYSLTNAPSWLALEDITNNARQGIIMRGVPGITGGQRGRADLGVTSRINLVGNDQATAGAQPFSIDVQENQLSVVSRDYSESAPEPEENPESGQGEDDEIPDFQCAKPVTEPMGEHTYSINLYDESGNVTGSEEKTSTTRPILVQVNLDQPSVTRIRVSFELRSGFNPNRCDQGFTPDHQRCDTGLANSDEAAAYFAHPVLGHRLLEASQAMLGHAAAMSAAEILGPVDTLKFRSSMTLFEAAGSGEDAHVFGAALDRFFDGKRDELTLVRL